VRKFAATVLVSMAAVMVLAGCSDDKKSTSTGASSSSGPAEKVATIGVIAPVDGGLTAFGRDIRNGAQLAVDQANANHAIPGWKIQLKTLDDSSDPNKGEAAARQMAADPTVIGVVGTYNSGVAATVAPVLDQAGIVMISPGNTNPSLTVGDDPTTPTRQWKHYFRMVASDSVQGPFLADQAYTNLNFMTAAVVSETKAVSKGLADSFSAAFTGQGGQVLSTQVVPDGTTDFTDVVNAIKPLNPDVIFFGGEYQTAAALRDQATTAGVTAPLMGGDGVKDDAYITAAGPSSNGDYASSIGQPVTTSTSAAKYLADYQAAGFTEKPGDFGPYAFDAANVLIAAAAKAVEGQTTVTDAVRADILDSVQATNTSGASGKIAFDQYGDTTTKVLTLYRVENGAWTAVTTSQVNGDKSSSSSSTSSSSS
jgi:branched-chain amino acid transport system substrate-binding protein